MKINFFYASVLTALLSWVNQAHADISISAEGAGSSGGGLILRDSLNPWWLQNTTQVHYCISFPEQGFSVNREIINNAIHEGLGYWRAEFAKVREIAFMDLEAPNRRILVATQEFIEVPCGDTVDLVFQMGYLSDDQRENLDDPSAVIATTVRTSYDRENLKGRGYIYFAPAADRSPARGLAGSTDIWSAGDSIYLRYTMIHELGHLFGLSHSRGSGIMGETAVEELVASGKEFAPVMAALVQTQGWPSVVLPTSATDFGVCVETYPRLDTIAALGKKVFGIPDYNEGKSCRRINYQNNTLQVFASKASQALSLTGEAKMVLINQHEGNQLVSFWLPPEHKNFFKLKSQSHQPRRRFSVAYEVITEVKGEFEVFSTGQKTSIAFELGPNMQWPPRISAVVDGELISNVFNGK